MNSIFQNKLGNSLFIYCTIFLFITQLLCTYYTNLGPMYEK